MNTAKILVWFRQDLRLIDNPALYYAASAGEVVPIYIIDENENKGAASNCWLYHSLESLNKSLQDKLNIFHANPLEIIQKLIQDYKITAVYWNRCYEPDSIARDSEIKNYLQEIGIECKTFNASLLWEPWNVLKDDKTSYKVFTPYYRNGCLRKESPRQPLPKPDNLILADNKYQYDLSALQKFSSKNWSLKIMQHWEVGEEKAQQKLYDFIDNGLDNYKEGRNFPHLKNTSSLSPYLHFGEISPNIMWHAVKMAEESRGIDNKDVDHFLSELGWREFSYYLLYHFPHLPKQNFQSKFDNFPWEHNEALFDAWKRGGTGYPMVDAGMRQLWQTGYMHNRVRMIVGSFLVKNLLIDWRKGQDWFWDCLVDADLASNSAGWQWIAGSGADAAPYFRIFNPVTQGEKFDANGDYTRHFIPELANLPKEYLFNPYKAPDHILIQAGIKLGETYPKPIISIDGSRERALLAYKNLQPTID
ncbi:MAG: DNA photolyase family protein [Rickettsiaceae bacterium]|nr:DNA photolyase family protein [Rickettsiaceae bacterium]